MAFQALYKSSSNFITRYRKFHCCCGKRVKCDQSIIAKIELNNVGIIKEPILYIDFDTKYKWRRVNNTKENLDHVYRLPFYYTNENMIHVLVCSKYCSNFRTVIDNFNTNHMIVKIKCKKKGKIKN